MSAVTHVKTSFDGADEWIGTLGDFFAANTDSDDGWIADAVATVNRGESYHGGGGAAAEFTVSPVTGDELAKFLSGGAR